MQKTPSFHAPSALTLAVSLLAWGWAAPVQAGGGKQASAHAAIQQDKQKLAADKAQLQADKAAGNKAAVQGDKARLQQDKQQLQADRAAAKAAKPAKTAP